MHFYVLWINLIPSKSFKHKIQLKYFFLLIIEQFLSKFNFANI